MATRSLLGVVPALVTPFREDERIDCSAWQVLIDMLVASGVDGLFVGGSSGEFCTMDMEERVVALRFCKQAVAGRVSLIANVGCITTRDTIALAQQAESIGADAIAVITPYYIRPTQQELTDHLVDVCRAVRMPVLAYNFPFHGGVELAPETLAAVAAKAPNLAGVKDSSGHIELAVAYRNAVTDRDFAVFTGGDHIMLAALEAGCAGTITAAANFSPKAFVDLYRKHRENSRGEALRLQALVTEMGAALGLHTFPAVVKEALAMAGFPMGPCRKPVGKLPDEARRKLAVMMDHLRNEGVLPEIAGRVSAS
uniref:Dihydrodipicolinate synthetase n=1 Tax=Solibacter usitatus (strain Ellin6076) TaxID=234267 RepID=Q01QH8_SOLUE